MAIPYRLGIDIGTNSLGWCILDLGRDGQPKTIRRLGVRIFSDGRDPQSGASLAVDRRDARSARRRRDRFLGRRADLMKALVRHGLMPADPIERKKLEALDPYELRARGLDERLTPHELGRAIFHLNQRRGFKSNRKTDKAQKDSDLKGMKGGISKLREAMTSAGARTLGEYLHVAFRKDRPVRQRQTVRARPHVVKNKNEYDLYADRAMYEEEFDVLWRRQAELGAPLADAARDEIKDIVFYQRPLKPVDPGKCGFEPNDPRAPRALPLSQRARILQESNNIRLIDIAQEPHRLTRAQRDKLVAELERKAKVTFKGMRRLLNIDSDLVFNLEDLKRDHLKGDDTAVKLSREDRFGSHWWSMTDNERSDVVELVLTDEPDEVVCRQLMSRWGLDRETAKNVIETPLEDGYGRVGRIALAKIVPIMEEQGLVFADAAAEAYPDAADRRRETALPVLPYYAEVLSHYAGLSTGEVEDPPETRFGRIANPTVHVGLRELAKVVNALIARYGRPEEIVVELARELKLSKEQKDRLRDQQAKNQKANDMRREKLASIGIPASGENMMRMRLWEELNPDEPQNRRCPYTGEQIGIERLFSSHIDIDHILPFKRTLDNSPANRTVSLARANRYKGNRSPVEAFGASADGYDWDAIQARAANLAKNKRWRFSKDAMEQFDKDRGFLDRQLTDTQYLARATREYLDVLYAKSEGRHVWVTPGRLTEMLRGKWGLNGLLSTDNEKNRADHRHHAIDAFVVGVTNQSMLQRIAGAADQFRDRLIEDMPDPWDGFRDEIRARLDKLVVSHKPDHGIGGKLHEETAYGLVRDPAKEDGATVVYRKPLVGLNDKEVARIRDKALRAKVQEVIAPTLGNKPEMAKALAAFSAETGIRHVRLTKVEDGLIVLKDRAERSYKAYSPGDNHCIDLYEDSGRWRGESVTVFAANQKSERAQTEGRFLMRVHKGDLLMLDGDARHEVYQVHRLDASANRFKMAKHNEGGNLDKRHADGDDPFRWLMIGYNQLKARKARKVTVDMLGRVRDPGPPK